MKWLDQLKNQTIIWVKNAIKNDKFVSLGNGDQSLHSSSVIDLFSVIYQELDFIYNLMWVDDIQRCTFYQKFLKVFIVLFKNRQLILLLIVIVKR